MNNEQFRRLFASNADKQYATDNGSPARSNVASSGSLGSRQRASIPMTPRSVTGRSDFARQLAERNQAFKSEKKFRSSIPKGSKLAAGYTDRTKARADDESDDRAARIKALEESFKKEEIDQVTFEKLRNEIVGGDLSSTHLVKGLDFKLLERIRKGEDVYNDSRHEESKPDGEGGVEDELDLLEKQKVTAIAKQKAEKKGQMATTILAPGKKRTRDQILAELKASREAAMAKESSLGNKFRKIGATQKTGSRIERDSKGREVLIIIDEDGHERRKVRKAQPGDEESKDLMMPDKTAKPLGMEVPEIYRKQQESKEEEDDNIFDDVGDDYDPLAGLGGDSDEDEVGEGDEDDIVAEQEEEDAAAMPPPPGPDIARQRNYFKDSKTALVSSEERKAPSLSDPSIMAALKKAASLKPMSAEADEDDEEAKAREARRKRMLQNTDRDAEDMDMGFGTSRFEDGEDFEDKRVKLSKWGAEDDEDGRSGSGKSKRKRGPKKRKGDGNNAADVLRVLERRKTESG